MKLVTMALLRGPDAAQKGEAAERALVQVKFRLAQVTGKKVAHFSSIVCFGWLRFLLFLSAFSLHPVSCVLQIKVL
jgi:hypothetical protein